MSVLFFFVNATYPTNNNIINTQTTKMMSYQKSPIIDENETAVLLVTKITPLPTTTTSGHGSKWRVALVAGMLLLLVACGVVWMRPERSSYTTAAEGLVVATQGHTPCLPATSTFRGISETTSVGKSYAFETCYKIRTRRRGQILLVKIVLQ